MRNTDWVKVVFIGCGGRLYMNWVLPTNYSSRNPVIRWLWRWHPGMESIDKRLKLAAVYGWIHLPVAFMIFISPIDSGTFWFNLLGNVYPVLVQLYVGYRCLRVKAARIHNKLRLNEK